LRQAEQYGSRLEGTFRQNQALLAEQERQLQLQGHAQALALKHVRAQAERTERELRQPKNGKSKSTNLFVGQIEINE